MIRIAAAWFAICTALILLYSTQDIHAANSAPLVVKLTLHDTIQPITAAYLKRGLDEAAAQHANAVLISMGTPGGLLESTREMVADIESSQVPVIIFIEPSGSRAGSAGFFLLESADIAAMAPGTNAGAAHPILEGTTMDPVLKQKVENDAAAFLRSYVTVRKRNAAAAENAVRNSKSYSEAEALKLQLIDEVAPDDSALLAQLAGRTVQRFNGASFTFSPELARAKIEFVPPSMRERLLTRLTSPDLDVLLLMCGGLLIYLEFNVPGTIVPGALGTLLVLLAIFGFNLLPIQHTSVLLLIVAIVLMVLEAKFASHGILALAGVVCLVFGLATLVNGPMPEMRVHYSIAAAAGTGFGTITFGLAWIAFRARWAKRLTGPQAMVGHTAIAMTPLAPTGQTPIGQVEVRGEIWRAVLAMGEAPVEKGAQVTVRSVDDLTLTVSSKS
ncbi:MAG TPA: nodulation protein NfeD [Acidobacteriaceae bacterium]|nr:nodulation protein NfeD [Acidobacteriaceae bacterium]